MSLSPLPPTPSFPSSPSSSTRKRSIHEVDDAALPSVGPKRALTTFTGENQENHDPTSQINIEKSPSQDSQDTKPTSGNLNPQVVIPFKNIGPVLAPTHGDSTVNNTGGETPQGSPVKVDMAAKKRKLSPNSKDFKQQEKELKERQRLEEKAKKDEEKKKRDAEREEEKRLKEEEKKKREAEREEKKKAKEEERKAKEEEKKAKEEEKKAKEEERKAKEEEKAAKEAAKEEAKLKKERAQPKLNSFFAKPQLPPSPANIPASPNKAASKVDEASTASQPTQSDYAKTFPEFFLQSHTVVAPPHRFERDADALTHVRHTIDISLNSGDHTSQPQPLRPSQIFHIIPYRRKRGRIVNSVKEILLRMQSLSDVANQPGNKVSSEAVKEPLDQLSRITIKSLKFGEDIRPAYQGTFTRAVPEDIAKKVCRNPYRRGIPEINYDYDSEAEWEEPEEGEDLDSEEEEEASDEDEDEMDGFLDDEDDALAGGKRRLIVGDLEPNCSGIQWAGDGVDEELKTYQIETISDAVQFPIDPFSTVYWQKPRTAEQALQKARATQKPGSSLDMFRVPPGPDAGVTSNGLPPPPPTSKARRPFPPEQLTEFKEVVEGSDLSKIGVVEILKKRFPKVSKDTLKATLDQVAVRVGQKEADKKWVCR
ncbi:hypothetical protein N7478_005632 [Penicillium angulare]|uniref:uncharacterized protein n=1 Tax=Penicillium angulare TaxID=116970 RepID=UPI0025401639|nr:uncharacterized protein N7478_005632 [Penicillium angulare]KAJ5280260.1 hypothetical protein N7478_005632 [Penicillium angulare]